MRAEQQCQEYLNWLRDVKGVRGVTAYNYAAILARFLTFTGGADMNTITLEQCEQFVMRPRRGGKPPSPSTAQKDAVVLREVFRYLLARGEITRDPTVLLLSPKVRNIHPKPVPDDAWLRIWQADLPTVERVAWGLGFYCGLRRREIAELGPHHVFVDAGTLVGFIRKGGGDDTLPYADLCEIQQRHLPHLCAGEFPAVLAEYVQRRRGQRYLLAYGQGFPSSARAKVVESLGREMTDPNLLNRRLRDRCAALDINHYTPHQLRHSFVTNLLRAGVPLHLVQRMANHSSPHVTSRYIKASGSELREWMRGLDRMD